MILSIPRQLTDFNAMLMRERRRHCARAFSFTHKIITHTEACGVEPVDSDAAPSTPGETRVSTMYELRNAAG